jgi:hypothetical protein
VFHCNEEKGVIKMSNLQVGDQIQLKVTKITLGKDGQVWVTVSHPKSPDHPTFRYIEDSINSGATQQ